MNIIIIIGILLIVIGLILVIAASLSIKEINNLDEEYLKELGYQDDKKN